MSKPTEEVADERRRLREQARTAENAEDRRDAIRQLAALERERNRDTYEKLAEE